jgi:poly(A) polymerase
VANPSHLIFTEIIEEIRAALAGVHSVYLVGGAVRDALLQIKTHDLDFVVAEDALRTGRRVANALGGAYYALDEGRQTARVILERPDTGRINLDFAQQRGANLEEDLRYRDFTMNAMAVPLDQMEVLIDPLGGREDMLARRLRTCSDRALRDDPLRILRGMRLASNYSYKISVETLALMKKSVEGLGNISAERIRDELFRILGASQPAVIIRGLDLLGALPYILPELEALKSIEQSTPHTMDVFNHSINTLQKLTQVIHLVTPGYEPEKAENYCLGYLSMRLGRYREEMQTHFHQPITVERSRLAILSLAALYHDSGKPLVRKIGESGKIRFLRHEQQGVEMIIQRGRALCLSNSEISHLSTIVKYHMRPLHLAKMEIEPTARSIYRFFRDTGKAGVEICLLSLADTLSTYNAELLQTFWVKHVDVVRELLEAWWKHQEEVIAPIPVVNGNDLIEELGISSGPIVGKLLEAVREAQVTGRVKNREDAIRLARLLMESNTR